MNLDERVTNAKWVLERTLSWISAADTKVAALTTIDLAMMTILATIFFSSSPKGVWGILLSIVAFLLIFLSLVFVWFIVVSRTVGPNKSNIFFGKIAEVPSDEFRERFLELTKEGLLIDLIQQIHVNSEIANLKHQFVRRSYFTLMLSVLPWLASIAILKVIL